MKKFGYYLTLPSIETDAEGNMTRSEQLAETADHVNLLWLDDRRLSPDDLANATMLGKACVIDVAGCLFSGKTIRLDAAQRLQVLRSYIKLHGRLSAVEVLVPVDEPNLPETDVAHLLPAAVQIMRDAWPEAKVGCIYYNDGKFRHHHLFDILGFDDYWIEAGAFDKPRWYERIKLFFGGFVRRGSYLRFAELLRPDQKTWLIPGGTYGERPERWVEFAKQRPEVWAMVPFLWAATSDGKERFLGISGQPEIRAAYVAAGKAIMESDA